MNRKVKSLLVARGIKQVDISRELGLDKSAVSGVLNGFWESRPVKEAIAKKLGMPYEKVWGKAA